jgi:hypothetical protein
LLNLVGMKSGCEEENNQLVSESLPPLDVDLYNRADAVFCTPLSFFFFFFCLWKTDCLGLEYSDWALQRVKGDPSCCGAMAANADPSR